MAETLADLKDAVRTKKGQPYWWTSEGVYKPGEEGKPRRLTFRPILPSAQGIDQDGGLYLRISWVDYRGDLQHRWIPEAEARAAKVLEALPGAPVDSIVVRELGRWIGYASALLPNGDRHLVTRLGWSDASYVWPGHMCGREWIGQDLDAPGDAEATRTALRHLVALPDRAGYLALACVALSAASPLVRWGCPRNPIIGLTERTSRGKSTAMRFALSLWGNHRTWSVQLSSTSKGVQDLAIQYPDAPVLVDDLHKLHQDNPAMAADLLYFLGNGQRRTTSSRNQVARGGEARYGAAMFASESSVLGGANGGVLMRVWELSGDPMPDAATARAVEEATKRGAGAIGPLLAQWYSDRGDRWRDILGSDYITPDGRMVDTSRLTGGDVQSIRVLAHGARALKSVALLEGLDEIDLCSWLINKILEQRSTQTDSVQAGFEAVMRFVLGGAWGKDIKTTAGVEVIKPNVLEIAGQAVAWRAEREDVFRLGFEDGWGRLDINADAEPIQRILWRHGGASVLLRAWRERGWIVPNGAHLRWIVRGHGRVAIRIAEEQLAAHTAPQEGAP